MSWQFISKLENCIFAESEQNKLKTDHVSNIFNKHCNYLGQNVKYSWYQFIMEAVSRPSTEVVTASIILLLHLTTYFCHIYNINVQKFKNLQPSLFLSLLWTSSALLNCEFILVHLNFWKSEEKKKEQKFVTDPTQKVSDL